MTILQWPLKPSVGDYIALDKDGFHPSFVNASWYCSRVVQVLPNDGYRVEYDDGLKTYIIPHFGKSYVSFNDTNARIFPAKQLSKKDRRILEYKKQLDVLT
jgi:hypothetical protein